VAQILNKPRYSMKKIVSVNLKVLFCLLISLSAFAQIGPQGYNPNSVRPIYEADVMYRTTVWRRINLLEKQNKPLFSTENEITKVIIDAVKEGKLQPYYAKASPRLTGFEEPMDPTEFLSKMKFYDTNVGDSIEVKPYELYLLDIKEDLIFDRRRSRMYWDIQTVTLYLPQGAGGSGGPAQMGDLTLANFKYKDLYEYFKKSYEESQEKGTFEELRSFWYNPENPRRHMSLADAFDLRMFSSRIWKVSNPDDDDIVTIINDEYGSDPQAAKKVLYMSQKVEYDLMEFEHNLWEF
jgi:gliding motility associated protien GldN